MICEGRHRRSGPSTASPSVRARASVFFFASNDLPRPPQRRVARTAATYFVFRFFSPLTPEVVEES